VNQVDTPQTRTGQLRIFHGATAQQPLYCSHAAARIAARPPQPLRSQRRQYRRLGAQLSNVAVRYELSSVVDVLRVNVALAVLLRVDGLRDQVASLVRLHRADAPRQPVHHLQGLLQRWSMDNNVIAARVTANRGCCLHT
jgi:hypothetical protein